MHKSSKPLTKPVYTFLVALIILGFLGYFALKEQKTVASSDPVVAKQVRCSSFKSRFNLDIYLITHKAGALDRDSDGVACESLK